MTEKPELPPVSVGSLNWARRHKRDGYQAILSLKDPEDRKTWLKFTENPRPKHLTIPFADVERVLYRNGKPHQPLDLRAPTVEQVQQGLDFLRGQRPVLIHCRAGVSRSTAMALGHILDSILHIEPDGVSEQNAMTPDQLAVSRLFNAVPHAVPNKLVVWHADVILQRGGALFEALVQFEAENLPGNDNLRQAGWEAHLVAAGIPKSEWENSEFLVPYRNMSTEKSSSPKLSI